MTENNPEPRNEEEESPQEPTRCPECGSGNLSRDYERGELVCGACGLVLDEHFIDQGPEWRAFDAEQREKRARTGAPMTYTLHDKGLSTEIGWRNRDSYGNRIPSKARAQMYRLRKWHRRSRYAKSTDRNLVMALSELDRMGSRIGLPRNVRETAAMIYRRAVQKNLIRGRSIEGVAAASLYAACRMSSVPRTLDEIAEASRVTRKELARTYRFLSRELKLKLLPTGPTEYIPRFASELNMTGEGQQMAIEILRKAKDKGLTNGKGPTGLAAAALYISSILTGQRRTQEQVSNVAGVTEVTVRNRYKEMARELDLDVDPSAITGGSSSRSRPKPRSSPKGKSSTAK